MFRNPIDASSHHENDAIIREIIENIKSSDKNSVEQLSAALRMAQARQINLENVTAPGYSYFSAPVSLIEYSCQHMATFQKTQLLYQYGASSMKSKWGREYEYNKALTNRRISDYHYYGNDYDDRVKCIDEAVESFAHIWTMGAEKFEKSLMVSDAHKVGLLERTCKASVDRYQSMSAEIINEFAEIPESKDLAHSLLSQRKVFK
ncbi:MAG: hypothetical protein SFW66_02055 [Gammaproteobacteria bacterium]|nr:hypothetical protein [Gammaproteobacteria bacterium]